MLFDSSSSLDIAEQSRPRCTLKEDIRQSNDTPQGWRRTTTYQTAKLTNWMNPFLWANIEKAMKRAGYQMSPTDIVREACKIDSAIFDRLAPQTVGTWIDRTGEHP